MRSQLQHTLKIARALMLVAAALLILALPAHAKGPRGGARRHAGVRTPVGNNVHVIHPGFGAVAAVSNLGWWDYSYNGTAVTAYGTIQYTPYGPYGWTLPGYFIPYPDPFPYGW